MKTLVRLAALTAICLTAALSPVLAENATGFQTLDGKDRNIESYLGQGQWLVVMLWAHDCHVCNQEAEQYAQFHDDHVDEGAAVLGISIDGLEEREAAQRFVARHDLPFPSLIAETEVVMRWYRGQTGTRFLGTPTLLIYAPDGKLKAAQAGAVPVEVIEQFIVENS